MTVVVSTGHVDVPVVVVAVYPALSGKHKHWFYKTLKI